MALAPGDKLGPCEIVGPLGAGGMGEVYRARDTRLKREVALKVLPESLAGDSDRMARLQREAEVLASLNHPNIAHIYGIEVRALMMELAEGESPRGPMPFDEAWKIALQIADALSYAHEKGVIHRDLKPANIKVTPDGVVKLLDFGLAKAISAPAEAAPSSPADAPTIAAGATMAGVILGTAAYMSPEQARGKNVDQRADIWAFGVVLYELLTGRQLFQTDDLTSTLASVVKDQPDLSAAPTQARPILLACLEKDPKKRLQSIGDVKYLVGQTTERAASAPRGHRFGVWGWVAASALALAVFPLAYIAYHRQTEEAPRAVRFHVTMPDKVTSGNNGIPQLSPDGRHIAFTARIVRGPYQLWVRDLDSLTSRLLIKDNVRYPFWSPDSRTIGFWAGGKLQKVDIAGGPPMNLAETQPIYGATWNRDDVILFSTGLGAIQRVSAAGGTPAPATILDQASGEAQQSAPWFLPDGRHFLYTGGPVTDERSAIYVGDLQSKEKRVRLIAAKSNAVYVPREAGRISAANLSNGYILFARDRALMAQAFDAGKLRVSGDAFPIADQVNTRSGPPRADFSASANGVLAFTSNSQSQDAQITWLDRSGRAIGTVGAPADIEWPALSPDGKTVAVDRRDNATGNYDIWLLDLARGTDSRFTFNSGNNRFPVWSPDGASLAFSSSRSGSFGVYKKALGGVGKDEAIDSGEPKRPTSWSPDNRFIIEESNTAARTRNDIWIAPSSPATGQKPVPYLQTEFLEAQGRVSPNGKWLAYRSDETGQPEIYIVTFPNLGGKWQISTGGGAFPIWARDGKQLFYVGGANKMMAVDIKGSGTNPEPGVPRPLFDVRLGTNNPAFDVSKDGRFLVPVATEQYAAVPVTVVVNWMAGLKK